MATYANVDKNDANAIHLLGVMKAVISDVRKQDSNKSKPKDGKKKMIIMPIMPTQLILLLKIIRHGMSLNKC